MMYKMKLMAIATAFSALSAFSANLLSVDFESDTVGLPPTASNVSPAANAPLNSNVVVNASVNTAGTGNGARMTDMNNAAGNRLEYDLEGLQSVSALRFDFNVASKTNYGGTGDYISACVVNSQTSTGASANRYAEVRLLANGHARFYSVGSYISNSDIGLDLDTGYKISMFVNDSNEEISNYVGARSLAPNTVDYWINDSYYISGDLNTVSGGTTNGLGRVGFATSTADLDLDWVLDDLSVSNVVSGAPVDYLLSEDYETGQTPGQHPNGASNVRPTVNNETAFVKIVDDAANTAGTGNGVQMFDNADVNSSTDITSMEYLFVADQASQISALRVDFSFAPLSTLGAGDKFIAVGIGEYNTDRTFQTTRNRYIDARLYNDGTIDFRTSLETNAPSSEGNALLPTGNTLSIYMNDYDTQSIDYTGLDGDNYTLPANSVAYWLNGDLVLMDGGEEYTVLDLDNLTTGGDISTTENNFGKFGFSSGTSEINLNYVIDDIYITTNILVQIDSYQEWLDLYPELGASTGYTDDFEPDGMNNLLEYALGGNPTVADSDTYLPAYSLADEGTSYLNYVYNRRINADALGLTYDVVSGADLGAELASPTEEAGSSEGEPGFDVVTNRVPVAASPVTFMQLNIEAAE